VNHLALDLFGVGNVESELIHYIANNSDEALVMVDTELRVRFLNEQAKAYMRIPGETPVGRHLLNELQFFVSKDQRQSVVLEAIQTGGMLRGVRRQTAGGRTLSLNITPVMHGGRAVGAILSATDITPYLEMEQELDLAFALTLPNSKVEHRLKSIVEYRDTYDPGTGLIEITGVVENGGYRHVVNCLKLFSVLASQGVTKLIGIDKDLLVQALIFHDLGKSQPRLAVGDVVDPRQVFEESTRHAFRSAEMACHFYGVREDGVEIIRYHHHAESALPETFPWRLLPMFRLFQLIDGLSAAMTRGSATARLEMQDCRIKVTEINVRPQYDGTRAIDLYTGEWIRQTS
jgi:hypothetical protein